MDINSKNTRGGENGSLVSSSAYTDTSVSNGTTNYYVVTAVDTNQNESGYSNEDSATPQSAGNPPAAPTNLTATAVSTLQINLSWTDNASDENGFKIERSDNNPNNFVQIDTVGADVTSYNDTGLTSKRTYYYRVRAYNDAGDSRYSNEASAKTQ